MKKILLLMAILPFFVSSFAQSTKSTVLTNAREKLGNQNFIRISKMIYAAATTGFNGKKIIAYTDDLLTTIATPEDILKKGGKEEAIQVPVNPKDPDSELIDTVIKNEFRPDDIVGSRLVQSVTKSADMMKYSADMIAFSLTYDLFVSGMMLGEQDLFYVKFEDLKTILDEKTYNDFVDACIP
jgi:hypothetical protein